jgi:hypothetical protein
MQAVVDHGFRSAGGELVDGGAPSCRAEASVCEVLADLEPGVLAMAYLRSLAGEQLDAAERVAVMRGWERQLRWVTAQAQIAIVAVAGPPPAAGADDDWIGLEVAVALELSPLAADRRLHVARTLARCLPQASAALQAGALSWRHVLRLIEDCAGLDDATISAVEARVIGRARGVSDGLCKRVL